MKREHQDDEMYASIVEQMARDLGVDAQNPAAMQLQLTVYDKTVTRVNQVAEETFDTCWHHTFVKPPKGRTVSGRRSSAFSDGVQEGKRAKRTLDSANETKLLSD